MSDGPLIIKGRDAVGLCHALLRAASSGLDLTAQRFDVFGSKAGGWAVAVHGALRAVDQLTHWSRVRASVDLDALTAGLWSPARPSVAVDEAVVLPRDQDAAEDCVRGLLRLGAAAIRVGVSTTGDPIVWAHRPAAAIRCFPRGEVFVRTPHPSRVFVRCGRSHPLTWVHPGLPDACLLDDWRFVPLDLEALEPVVNGALSVALPAERSVAGSAPPVRVELGLKACPTLPARGPELFLVVQSRASVLIDLLARGAGRAESVTAQGIRVDGQPCVLLQADPLRPIPLLQRALPFYRVAGAPWVAVMLGYRLDPPLPPAAVQRALPMEAGQLALIGSGRGGEAWRMTVAEDDCRPLRDALCDYTLGARPQLVEALRAPEFGLSDERAPVDADDWREVTADDVGFTSNTPIAVRGPGPAAAAPIGAEPALAQACLRAISTPPDSDTGPDWADVAAAAARAGRPDDAVCAALHSVLTGRPISRTMAPAIAGHPALSWCNLTKVLKQGGERGVEQKLLLLALAPGPDSPGSAGARWAHDVLHSALQAGPAAVGVAGLMALDRLQDRVLVGRAAGRLMEHIAEARLFDLLCKPVAEVVLSAAVEAACDRAALLSSQLELHPDVSLRLELLIVVLALEEGPLSVSWARLRDVEARIQATAALTGGRNGHAHRAFLALACSLAACKRAHADHCASVHFEDGSPEGAVIGWLKARGLPAVPDAPAAANEALKQLDEALRYIDPASVFSTTRLWKRAVAPAIPSLQRPEDGIPALAMCALERVARLLLADVDATPLAQAVQRQVRGALTELARRLNNPKFEGVRP